jgi:membrane-bound lytic murein transglycosylase B
MAKRYSRFVVSARSGNHIRHNSRHFQSVDVLDVPVDADGDDRRDLWQSLPDVFASSANYLRAIGWQPGERWGRQVLVPDDFPWELAELSEIRSLAEWRRLGVTQLDGNALPQADMTAALILPMGHRGRPFWSMTISG